MILVRLSVQDERLIEKANTEPELRGLRQLMLDRIAVSKTLKAFGKAPTLKQPSHLPWAKALAIVKEVVGEGGVTIPPYPDNSWYARISGFLRREGMTEEYVRGMAEYARDHLRKPVSFDFLICQHLRIRNGEFDVAPPPVHKEIELPKLPED